MPLKRKAAREEDTTSLSGTEDDGSSVDMTNTLRSRTRRLHERDSGAGPTSVPSSPALNTRRSSRLSAQVEQQKQQQEERPRARLKRGLRGGVGASSPVMSRGGRGSRGKRGRGRPRRISSARDSPVSRTSRKAARVEDSTSVTDSTSASDSESAGDFGAPEQENSTHESNEEDAESSSSGEMSDGEKDNSQADSVYVTENIKPARKDVAKGDELSSKEDGSAAEDEMLDANDNTKDAPSDEDDDEENDEEDDDENGAKNTDTALKKTEQADTSMPAKKGGRGRPSSKPKAAEYLSESAENSMEEDNGDIGMDGTVDNVESSDIDGESGTAVQINLTRRQRAKLTRDYDEELIELPVESKRSKFSAEEVALRKSEHARRRKFQSMQRAEQLKNDTINRLLNKQTSKGRNKVSEDVETRATSAEEEDIGLNQIRYTQRIVPTAIGSTSKAERDAGASSGSSPASAHMDCALSLPRSVKLTSVIPGATQKGFVPNYPPQVPLCSVQGCGQKKKYSVKPSHAACSLDHWRILSVTSANTASK
ncbi:INO80 complex subunit B [Coemansia spiralis]|uniref:INO80 complex subunit B n=2 Tax=Coemansia TaxID=4863 RepID=A0A9W8G5Z6_9FUNG|nr:hypothetical protein BX070DRAFT_137192 [Coemansia spiralis]KAJ1991950.1 INO80 complex subunit B [Coemansia umbellata]KAJ2625321.1 INO80 complex subunit B [Coemansia sp. RSA 1358]KAJ2676210.1 INO80 complex subunit B [Coemansia spiralis]